MLIFQVKFFFDIIIIISYILKFLEFQLEWVAGSTVEEELPLDLGVVDLLVQPPLVVHLELVRQLDVLTQDRVDAVVYRLEVVLL